MHIDVDHISFTKWLKLFNLLHRISPRVHGTKRGRKYSSQRTKRGRKTIAIQILTSHTSSLVIRFHNLDYSSSCHSVTVAYMCLRWTWKENFVALNSSAVYLPPVASTCLSKELHTNLNFHESPQQRSALVVDTNLLYNNVLTTSRNQVAEVTTTSQSFLYKDKSQG